MLKTELIMLESSIFITWNPRHCLDDSSETEKLKMNQQVKFGFCSNKNYEQFVTNYFYPTNITFCTS